MPYFQVVIAVEDVEASTATALNEIIEPQSNLPEQSKHAATQTENSRGIHSDAAEFKSVATQTQSKGESPENALDEDESTETLTDNYLQCVAKLKFVTEKISNLVSYQPNVLHFESLFTEITEVCDTVTSVIKETKSLAVTKLKKVIRLPDTMNIDSADKNISVDHDPGKRPDSLTECQKKFLISNGPYQPLLSIYPRNSEMAEKGKQCSFSPVWYKEFPYIEYSISTDKAYCFVCSLFGRHGADREKAESAWLMGMSDWSKMKGSRGKNKAGKLLTHFSSKSHAAALEDYVNFVRLDNHVDFLLTKQEQQSIVDNKVQMEKNREVIEIFLDIVRTLTRNGLALRGGENDGDGNFCQIVHLISRHNPTMKSWLDSRSTRKYRASYMSPQSQNELIQLLGEEIRKSIRQRAENSGICCVMADTTPDISVVDELSVAIRFVNLQSLELEERLVKVSETYDKTGEGQAQDIIKSLNACQIPLTSIQFQTYDSTASMSGRHKGAQQKMNEVLSREVPYIQCLPHGINLVIQHASESSPLINNVFDVLQQIYVFFSKSTKKYKQLKESMENIENALKLRNLSQTRWSARPESVEAVWRSLDSLIGVLHCIADDRSDTYSKSKAAGLINAIVNIDFICGIMILKNIMYKTKILTDFLQGQSVDISAAVIAINSTLDLLRRLRQAESEIDDEISASLAVARTFSIDPEADFSRIHRMRRPSARLDDRPNTTAIELRNIQCFYRSQFYMFLDTLITSLETKLTTVKKTFEDFLLALDPLKPGSIDVTKKLISNFPSVFNEEVYHAIHNELQVFFEYAKKELKEEAEIEDLPSISKAGYLAMRASRDHGLFKSVAKLYQMFLSAAPSVCKNERSFSALKRIKTHLRNSMSGGRLDDCMLLAVEKDITEDIDLRKLSKKWSILKNRREKIL